MNQSERRAATRVALALATETAGPALGSIPSAECVAEASALASMRARLIARRAHQRDVATAIPATPHVAAPTSAQLEYAAALRDAVLPVVRGADEGSGDFCTVRLEALLALAAAANVMPPLALVDQRRGVVTADEITPKAIKAFRKARGWSQRQLAERVGVSLPTINNWECGRYHPSPRWLARLQRLMNTTE